MADVLFAVIQVCMVFAVWSYLYKENLASRIATTIVISISTVFYFMSNMIRVWDVAVIPLTKGRFSMIIPIVLGLLLYTRISKTYSWLSAYSYSIQLGLGTGATLTTLIASSITGLISSTVLKPFQAETTLEQASGIILLIGTILSLTYWIFTKEATGWFGWAVKIGRLFLMASIGMLYAEDVLWAQSIFVGAWQIVIRDFLKNIVLGMG